MLSRSSFCMFICSCASMSFCLSLALLMCLCLHHFRFLLFFSPFFLGYPYIISIFGIYTCPLSGAILFRSPLITCTSFKSLEGAVDHINLNSQRVRIWCEDQSVLQLRSHFQWSESRAILCHANLLSGTLRIFLVTPGSQNGGAPP